MDVPQGATSVSTHEGWGGGVLCAQHLLSQVCCPCPTIHIEAQDNEIVIPGHMSPPQSMAWFAQDTASVWPAVPRKGVEGQVNRDGKLLSRDIIDGCPMSVMM